MLSQRLVSGRKQEGNLVTYLHNLLSHLQDLQTKFQGSIVSVQMFLRLLRPLAIVKSFLNKELNFKGQDLEGREAREKTRAAQGFGHFSVKARKTN